MKDLERPSTEPLAAVSLRWRCDPRALGFETTAEVEPIRGIIGQDAALEALRFGLEIDAPGQNVFVRGLAGTGRMTLVEQLLEEIEPPARLAFDRAYVHDFEQSDRPRLVSLPRGAGCRFRGAMDEFIEFIRGELSPALNGQVVRARKSEIDARFQERMQAISEPFDSELRERELALVQMQVGDATRPAIVPLIDGQPVPPEQLEGWIREGKIDAARTARFQQAIKDSMRAFEDVALELQNVNQEHGKALREFIEAEARKILERRLTPIRCEHPGEDVAAYLNELVEDCVTRRLGRLGEDTSFTDLYRVNLIVERAKDDPPPVIVENIPTLGRLVGLIEPAPDEQGQVGPLHLAIHAGSLLRADGGFLILEAREVVSRPESWAALMRTLRNGVCEVVSPERIDARRGPTLKPEAIPVNVKVILLGDSRLYAALDALDSDFPHLFKVLVDFDSTIGRDAEGLRYYAGVLARIQREEELSPFDREAVAALVEHGARIAAQAGKLTSRFGRLMDLAREAAFLARREGRKVVSGADVRLAIRRTKQRAELTARKFREHVVNGTIRIATQGLAVGEVNGLAVIQAGPLSYGFPSRITATIGAGRGGAVNIEREAELSGAIHTKGFYILGGLLRYLLKTDHPLSFDASIAFEQSYGGIDGDSASGAEMCCLLSALTDIPLRQDVAMTGAIDQVGNILPVGAVNEKIEGFFDTCVAVGVTGTQGVIVPLANAGDLMLREDVVAAAEAGEFAIWAAGTIQTALTLFTGRPAQEVLAVALRRAKHFWNLVDGEASRRGGHA